MTSLGVPITLEPPVLDSVWRAIEGATRVTATNATSAARATGASSAKRPVSTSAAAPAVRHPAAATGRRPILRRQAIAPTTEKVRRKTRLAASTRVVRPPTAASSAATVPTRGPQRGLARGSQGDLLLLDEHAGAHQRRRPEPLFVRFPCEPDVAP